MYHIAITEGLQMQYIEFYQGSSSTINVAETVVFLIKFYHYLNVIPYDTELKPRICYCSAHLWLQLG